METQVSVSVISILLKPEHAQERREFVAALDRMRNRLQLRLRRPPGDFIAAEATDPADLLQLTATICNICTLNLDAADPELRGYAQAGYWICQLIYGMTVRQKTLVKFADSGKDTRFLKQTYGFLKGFRDNVKVPEPLNGQLRTLVDEMDAIFGSLGSLKDTSSTGW